MALTFKQLMNNIRAVEEDIKQKVEACKVLANGLCFEEAQVMAIRIKGQAAKLEELLDNFNFETADLD